MVAVALPQYDSDLLLASMFGAMIALAAWLLLEGVIRHRVAGYIQPSLSVLKRSVSLKVTPGRVGRVPPWMES